jgi:branched-chain amino acid transport system substrate-binding protein
MREVAKGTSSARLPQVAVSIAGIAALAILMAACGSTPSASKSASASKSTAAPSAVTSSCSKEGAPIALGTVGTQSGPSAIYEKNGPLAVQAWVDMTNAAGGIDCHPIKYYLEDDNGNPAQNLSLTEQLVTQDHVDAFIMLDAAQTLQASVNYLVQQDIPVIGADTAWQTFYEHPNFFPQDAMGLVNTKILFAGADAYGKSVHKTTEGIVDCEAVSICDEVRGQAPITAKQLGIKLAYLVETPLTQSIYTSQCLAAKSAGVDLMYLANSPPANIDVANNCASVGFDPAYATSEGTFIPAMTSVPSLNGLTIISGTIPFFDTANAQVAAFRNALAKYEPSIAPDGNGMQGWDAALMFQAAMSNVPKTTGPVTSRALLAGMDKIKNNDLGGTTDPLTFTAGKDAPQTECFFLMQVREGHYSSPNNDQRTCLK